MTHLQLGQFAALILLCVSAHAQGVASVTSSTGDKMQENIKSGSTSVCPFTLGPICFQPAVGAIYAKRSTGGDYRDLRFAAVLHEKNLKTHSWGVMVAPGEKFIDALGIGGAYNLFDINGGRAILNYGLLAKRFSDSEPIRGGAYMMLSVQLDEPSK